MPNDLLRMRAKKLFRSKSTVTDHDLLSVFTVREIKQLEKAGLIATDVACPEWRWAKEERGR